MTEEMPRRCQLDKLTPSERAILDAVQMVESFGASTHLTEAVILLQKARDKVADFVDGVNHPLVSYPQKTGRRAVHDDPSPHTVCLDPACCACECGGCKKIWEKLGRPNPEYCRTGEHHVRFKGLVCEGACGTKLESWWCLECNAKQGRPPQKAQEVTQLVAERDAALARIKSLEDGIVAENRRTSAIEQELEEARLQEQELQNVEDLLVARDEGLFYPDGDDIFAEVVERILGERDRTLAERDELLKRVEELEHDTVVLNEALIKTRNPAELVNIRLMLAETTDDQAAELIRLRAPDETAAAVSALLSHDKARETSFKAQSRALDAADERASTPGVDMDALGERWIEDRISE